LSILSHFPQENESTSVKIIQPESYNPLMPSALFDEASQNQNHICGVGAVIHLSENNLLRIKIGLGPGTNNFFELMSLKLLLLFTGEKGIWSIQLFGNSTNVINWVRTLN
jgi:ribonuclease HI